jgi:Inner membrane component domain
MRLLLNVIWFVLAGLWMAIGYAFAALLMFILIITIPFGVAALRIGIFTLWPFGKTVVRRADAARGCAARLAKRPRARMQGRDRTGRCGGPLVQTRPATGSERGAAHRVPERKRRPSR